jgi:Flavin reductase like domain
VPTATRIDLPRPAIIAALGVLVLAITFLVTKPGDDTGGSAAAPTTSTATQTTASGTDTTASTGTSTTATSTSATPAKNQPPAVTAGAGLPSDVARALNAHKVVVLFFYEPAASDDQATRAAVRSARSAANPAAGRAVAVFQDVVARISDYRRVVGSLGISQSPAMVVIDRDRKARLLQGYLDSGTIRQTVRDAF